MTLFNGIGLLFYAIQIAELVCALVENEGGVAFMKRAHSQRRVNFS